MPPLLAKPRHAKPAQLPGTRTVLVPLVLMGSAGASLGGLALSASAEEPVAVTAAASTALDPAAQAEFLTERAAAEEGRASRNREADVRAAEQARVAAEQAAAAEAARVAAEQAAAAEAARVAAEKAAADKAAAEKAAAAKQAAPSGKYARPGLGTLTSGYGARWGRLHAGIDLAAGTGSPVRAAAAGTVVSARVENGYGKAVRVKHADGSETLYAHNSALQVRAGQRVGAGEQIAREGNSGRSTGPHLHFEVRVGGKSVNPLSWLRARGVAI